jgi:hypothetical protein
MGGTNSKWEMMTNGKGPHATSHMSNSFFLSFSALRPHTLVHTNLAKTSFSRVAHELFAHGLFVLSTVL